MMAKENILADKSEDFALRVVDIVKKLQYKREQVLSNQLLRAGTSIGANIAEAQYAQSRDDFISKMSIALKECAETNYWLRLLSRAGYFENIPSSAILSEDCNSLQSLLVATVKTAKQRKDY